MNFWNYLQDDSGAITVDWVLITGFLVGFGLAVTAAIGPALINQGDEIVTRATISTSFY